jgi:hypothetical protein
MADEQRYVLGVAYQAGPDPKIRKGMDGTRDYFSEVELEKAAFNFLRNGPVVGLFHAEGTAGAATVVESYIYRGPDWKVAAPDGSSTVVKKGDWLVGAILSPEAWALYKRGIVTGWSPQGVARRRITPRSSG